MHIYHSFDALSPASGGLGITIGTFDGVHLGHAALLHRLKEVAPRQIIITFSNHPSEILHQSHISNLTTLPHRLTLLEQLGIKEILLIPFTKSFAQQSAEEFLTRLKKSLSFSHLILGHDAVVGCDRQKDLTLLSHKLGFTLEYLKPVHQEGILISSSVIRKCIQLGRLEEASLLLGRPYSILASVQPGAGQGGILGFHTANLPVEELALPPLGVYAVEVRHDETLFFAVANLGKAPTLHHNRPTVLEVHLLDTHQQLYGQKIEVLFHRFIREEQHFPNTLSLKQQILKDIEHAKAFFLCTASNAREKQ